MQEQLAQTDEVSSGELRRARHAVSREATRPGRVERAAVGTKSTQRSFSGRVLLLGRQPDEGLGGHVDKKMQSSKKQKLGVPCSLQQ